MGCCRTFLTILTAIASLVPLTLASDPCGRECVLGRLASLEQKQRESDAENRELRKIISEQRDTMHMQDRRINMLEDKLSELQKAIPNQAAHEETNKEVHKYTESIQVTTDNDKLAKRDITTNWKQRNTAKNTVNVINYHSKRQERAGIAFSAYLDHDVDTSNHQTVRFNKIITNEGSSYNNHTGVFTCPEAGMYLLTFNVGEREITGVWVKLLINSVNIVDGAVDTYHASQDLQGGNTVIIRLKAGDSVWLESHGGHVEGSESLRLTTFSGVFLYP